jgi:pyrroloquinoline quinone (PQQ) biosynthesis protein C
MSFFETLNRATEPEQKALAEIPAIARALQGDISLSSYVAFLSQAYHHVKHTVPLLMATGAALPERHAWLRQAIAQYIREEIGHEEWILGDIAACGADPEAVRRSEPDRPCELLVAYAYDVVHRRNPLGFFGMVHVLEGTSARIASRAAGVLQAKLGLPRAAFTYLTTHGSLDLDHVDFFRSVVDRIDDPADQRWVIHCAKTFFDLYGDVFRGLPLGSSGEPQRRQA